MTCLPHIFFVPSDGCLWMDSFVVCVCVCLFSICVRVLFICGGCVRLASPRCCAPHRTATARVSIVHSSHPPSIACGLDSVKDLSKTKGAMA